MTMSGGKTWALQRLSHAVLVLIIALIFAGLVLAVVALPPVAAGLSQEVNAELARTGTSNPVTATLLSFRSYDTLLEIGVLLLAVTAIRALRHGDLSAMSPGGEILAFLGHILPSVMILIAGYLLWSGADAPGGAFQAGAILAAAGVLLILAGRQMPLRENGVPIRLGLAIGLALFVAVGIAGMLFADGFLGYPTQDAAAIVLLLEIGASVSIALALLDMFLSVLCSGNTGSTTPVTKRQER
jgi:multisubunit Na+/H+ antiporter MnhB subunit